MTKEGKRGKEREKELTIETNKEKQRERGRGGKKATAFSRIPIGEETDFLLLLFDWWLFLAEIFRWTVSL